MMTAARRGALMGNMSALSRKEMGYDLCLRMTNKPQLYLDARRWLENYGTTFAEQSPNSLMCTLPPGRKHFYYCAYQHDRTSDNLPYASLSVFLMCWRVDVSWLVIAPGNQQQSKCGVCMFFKLQIDSAQRGSAALSLLKSRLGMHFQFQAAQRLCQDRVEEACAQSQGDLWMMKIDRMDQSKTILPAIWALLPSPLFKLGERLVTSVIGSRWSGTGTGVHYLLRNNFEDFSPGADTQCSVVLENLLYVGMKAGRLPNEFVISADNTVKETKNNCFVHFCIWLLSILSGTNLWSIVFMSLITGHTHDSLDRFFSLLRQSLMGHDYFTLDDLWNHVRSALASGDNVHTAHVCQTWAFTQLGTDARLPKIHCHDLPRIHVFNVFRSVSGMWIKWKQFMTDDVWSLPVLLIGARRIRQVAVLRPANVDARFNRLSEMQSWSRKLEETLVDQLPTKRNLKAGIDWFRQVITHTHPQYNGDQCLPLEQIITTLVRIGTGTFSNSLAICDAGDHQSDILVQHFPGADVPVVPVDGLLRFDGAIQAPSPPRCLMNNNLVICTPQNASIKSMPLLFSMGRVISCPTDKSPELLLSWWVPPLNPVVDHKTALKRKIVDLFESCRC